MTQDQPNTITLEAATYFALCSIHGVSYGLHATGCETCQHLRAMRYHLDAQAAPEITDAEAQLMGELLLIEHELALHAAEEDFTVHGIQLQGDTDPWTHIEHEAYRPLEAEVMRKAVLYLKHRRRIETHPEFPNLVKLKASA